MIQPTQSIKFNGLDYPLAWGKLAIARFRSIPPQQRNLVGPAQLAQILWAAYRGVVHPFPSWEHVFGVVVELSEANSAAIDAAVAAVLPEAEPKQADADDKSAKEPSDAEKKSSSSASEPLPDAASA
jgi:hypothetical protein